jgi:hypothetical protein
MATANGGHLPRFSKYSGVAPWADGYFLWINVDVDPGTGRSRSEHPNEFLDGGERMTWFGGSTMHPESAVVLGLLQAGRTASSISEGEQQEEQEQDSLAPPPHSVVVFVREVKRPYACFGRVALDRVDLSRRPVRMTWRFLDYSTRLKSSPNFKRILALAAGTGSGEGGHGDACCTVKE